MSWIYLDTSAAVKLVEQEPESAALRAWIDGKDMVASQLLQTELIRSARRRTDALDRIEASLDLLAGLLMVSLDEEILRRAAYIGSSTLRSLDAIHLATADRLRRELDAVVTYDARLAHAARELGFTVVAPGAGS